MDNLLRVQKARNYGEIGRCAAAKPTIIETDVVD